MIDGITDEDWARQAELEEEMRSSGIDRFHRKLERAREHTQDSTTPASRRVIDHYVHDIAAMITEWVSSAERGRATIKGAVAPYLKGLEHHAVAHMTLRLILDQLALGVSSKTIARRLGETIEDEVMFRRYAKEHTGNWMNWLRHYREHAAEPARTRTGMKLVAGRTSNFQWTDWSVTDKVALGHHLIDITVRATGLFKYVQHNHGRKTKPLYLEMTADALQWVNEEHSRLSTLLPLYLPTVIPPRPWEGAFGGGYWTDRVRPLRMVKTYDKDVLADLSPQRQPTIFAAINAVQETAWAVNVQVYEVMKHVFYQNLDLADVPPAEDHSLPPVPAIVPPFGTDKRLYTQDQTDALQAWKSKAAQVHEANHRLVMKRLQFSRILMVAERFKDEPEIYFPCQLDFRGRLYYVPLFLQPQGTDHCRGLLQFANGLPIADEEDAGWLAVHGANSFGVDKVSFDDRLKWVADNDARILATADDPYSNLWWTEADAPFAFLAFCFEWAGFQREGYGFVSRLPIGLDGSCNGLQHLSAILRDEVGGGATNLTPSEEPADIYAEVAKVVAAKVKEHADAGSAVAEAWLPYIDRKSVKRPVMTLGYGATPYGFIQQVFEDTVRPLKDSDNGAPIAFGHDGWQGAIYLGRIIWSEVGEVVIGAREVMAWLQLASDEVAKLNLPIQWTNPCGMLVRNNYFKEDVLLINLSTPGRRTRLKLKTETTRIHRGRMTAACSPNFVHSMDSCHMAHTVAQSAHEGMASFAMIHDSFATHAANTARLSFILRDEFIRLYESYDVLDNLRDEIKATYGIDLPPPPARRSLVLDEVRDSLYFFA